MKSRLNTLKYFLDEAGDDRQRFRANFPSEMRNRQRIEEILKEVAAEIAPELKERLSSIDHRIRVVAGASTFIWDETLKANLPADAVLVFVCEAVVAWYVVRGAWLQ